MFNKWKQNDPFTIFINSSQDIYYSSAVIFRDLRELPRMPKDYLKDFYHFPHMNVVKLEVNWANAPWLCSCPTKTKSIHLFGKSQVFRLFKITVSVNAPVMENRK